jgi:hypothetical protein
MRPMRGTGPLAVAIAFAPSSALGVGAASGGGGTRPDVAVSPFPAPRMPHRKPDPTARGGAVIDATDSVDPVERGVARGFGVARGPDALTRSGPPSNETSIVPSRSVR